MIDESTRKLIEHSKPINQKVISDFKLPEKCYKRRYLDKHEYDLISYCWIYEGDFIKYEYTFDVLNDYLLIRELPAYNISECYIIVGSEQEMELHRLGYIRNKLLYYITIEEVYNYDFKYSYLTFNNILSKFKPTITEVLDKYYNY